MQKVLFRGNKFTIVQETVRVGKSTRETEYCKRGSSVVVLVVSDGGKLLLLKEKRRERGGYSWGLVAGHLEIGEEINPMAAAKRELKEEAGIIPKKMRLFFISEPSSSIKWKRYVYLVEGLEKSNMFSKMDADEKIEVHYVSRYTALQMALRGDIKNETAALAIIKYLSKKYACFGKQASRGNTKNG